MPHMHTLTNAAALNLHVWPHLSQPSDHRTTKPSVGHSQAAVHASHALTKAAHAAHMHP